MFLELDKYCWNSLRKGRLLAFENDIQQMFTVFTNHMLQPQDIDIQQYQKIAQLSQFNFLVNCRGQQQEQQEYIQLIYQVLIGTKYMLFNRYSIGLILQVRKTFNFVDNYFLTKSNQKQIFAIYGLYYIYSQLERKRRINVNTDFLDQFSAFLNFNRQKIVQKKQYMIIAKRILQSCLNIGIKSGVKTCLIKLNGQAARPLTKHKYPQNTSFNFQMPSSSPLKRSVNEGKTEQLVKLQKQQSLSYLNSIKQEISCLLQPNLMVYNAYKERFNNSDEYRDSQNKLLFSDNNLGIIMKKYANLYEKLGAQKFANSISKEEMKQEIQKKK